MSSTPNNTIPSVKSMTSIAPGNCLPVDYKLGEYVIQAVLGQGGFGITYLAQDTRLNSQVAIKEYFPQAYASRDTTATIRPHTTPTGSLEHYEWGLNEFLKEAQALAKFKHAHIVRVLRFLEANGTAYMVMEYEEGESLLAYLRSHGGSLPEPMLLNIFIPVLTGLQAVHDAGLLHLDIKPDNIYLRKNGQPMLIDFGSARQADAGASQKVSLSRGYAAPEQYPGHGERGPWSDVYGAGASLYRCISAREPMDALERELAVGTKRIDPLPSAASLERPHYAPHIRAAIDEALRLDAKDRPRSARALQNGLMGKEIKDEQAKPWIGYGRGTGFIGVTKAVISKRRRGIRRGKLEKLFAVLLFTTVMLVVIPKLMLDTENLTEAELYASLDGMQETVRSVPRRLKQVVDEDVLGRKPTPLAQHGPRPIAPRAAAPEKIIPTFEPAKQVARTIALPALPVGLAFLLDGRIVAVALNDGTVQLWNSVTGEWMRSFSSKAKGPATVAASPDGLWLAYAGADHAVHLWNAVEDKQKPPLQAHTETVNAIVFSADGKWLATGGEDLSVVVWDLANGTKRHTLKPKAAVLALAFAPNGRMLAAADTAGGIQYWEIPGGGELVYTAAQDEALTTLAYSPDGKWLASGGQHGFLKLQRTGLERDEHAFAGAPEVVNAVAFSPDGKWLILAGLAEVVEIRDSETGAVSNRLAGHARAVQALAVSADGRLLASGDDDNVVRLWR